MSDPFLTDLHSSDPSENNLGLPNGRILALDVGKKRIGLAVSDELGFTAQGLDTLHRARIRDDLKQLAEIGRTWNVHTLLIGNPLHMSGNESRQGEYTREFSARLQAETGLPVVFWDERLTSAEAERVLKGGGATLDQRRSSIDQMAAILLLDSYLQYLAGQSVREDQSA